MDKMKSLFLSSLLVVVSTSGLAQNPIIQTNYTADPAPMVYNDKVYLYTTHDEDNSTWFTMNDWRLYTTSDMVNWTDHGAVLSYTDFSWAKGDAWAPQCIERDGKFYMYVPMISNINNRGAIGVAVADSPYGPFYDPLGKPLVQSEWGDIDPTVFIDDDGQAYLYWGNTQCYYVKLKKNMIELDGPIVPVHLPRYTEAPWIHKRGDWYYLSYASEFPEKICYAMSRSITGPWEYKGILNEIAGNSNTNHQAIIEFKDDWYFIYHNGSINTAGGSFRRSVCIDRLYYNEDGTMKRIQMTTEGVQ